MVAICMTNTYLCMLKQATYGFIADSQLQPAVKPTGYYEINLNSKPHISRIKHLESVFSVSSDNN